MRTDIQIYCDAMLEIRDRLNVIQTIMAFDIHIGLPGKPALQDQTNEIIFVQFRKVLEGIAFASLSANRHEYAAVHENFARHWRAKDMLAVLEKVNPGFFPVPTTPPIEESPGRILFDSPALDNVFTREDFIFLYQCSSEILHTRNPYREGEHIINVKHNVMEWVQRLQRLLKYHRTHLLNGDVWLVQIPAEGAVTAHELTDSASDRT